MWKLVNAFLIGGLLNVGFKESSDILMVVSHQGRGIFDCLNGKKIARESDELFYSFDEETGDAKGFDILAGQKIKTYGLFGGDRLPKITSDGWKAWETDQPPFENSEGINIILTSRKDQNIIVGNDNLCELRAYGFSPTAQTFILALTCELAIYRRADD